MASQIKLVQLTEKTTANNGDFLVIDNGAITNKITKSNLLKDKVDKVDGKGLSTNDYTTTEKEKLAGIEVGANKYVLPSDVVKDSSYVHTDNNYTTSEKNKLAGLSNYDDSVLSERVTAIENQESTWNGKQDKNDNSLETTSKTVVGGINELKNDTSLLKALGLKVIEGYICQE